MEIYWFPLMDSRKMCVSVIIFRLGFFSWNSIIIAGSGKSIIWFVVRRLLPVETYSVISSSVIQHITDVCKTGSAIMAYFYFDFRELHQ